MPINNLNNVHLTEAKKAAINEKLTALENELIDLVANLITAKRYLYGSVNEEQERSINMDWDGHQNSP